MKIKSIAGLIAIAAVVAVAMLAGCVEVEEPTPTPMPTTPAPPPKTVVATPEPTVSNIYASDKTTTYAFRKTLSDQGFQNVNILVADGRDKGGVKDLMVSYSSTALTEDDLREETASILGVYIGVVRDGGDFDELAVVVGDRNDIVIGMWHCKKDWANGYINGKLSTEALLVKVFRTMTTL